MVNIGPELATRLIAYRRDPVLFGEEVLGITFEEYQKRILRAMVATARARVAWHAGRGCGKTLVAAVLVLWHLFLFYESRTVTTASNWRQVASILWPEVHKWRARMDFSKLGFTPDVLDVQKLKLLLTDSWQASGESTNNPSALEGYHSHYMLFIVDEAKIVSRATFHSIESSLTMPYNKILVISTPPRSPRSCYFRDICEHRIPGYQVFHTSGLESIHVDKEWANSVTDPLERRTQVEGLFVDSSIEILHVFPPDLLDKTAGLELECDPIPVVMGVDIARYGGDSNVVMIRRGMNIGTRIESWSNRPLTYTEGRIKAIAREEHPDVINIDVIGYGAGIYDGMLEEGEFEIEGINFKGKTRDDRYANMRAYSYFELATLLKQGRRSIPDHPLLLRDLAGQTYDFNAQGRMIIDPKILIRKALGFSPDYGDAATLCSLESEFDSGEGGGSMW